MAQFQIWKSDVVLEVSMALSEKEARALHSMSLYGAEKFLEMFREHLGAALKGNEDGLRTLFEGCRDQLAGLLDQARDARRAFKPHERG